MAQVFNCGLHAVHKRIPARFRPILLHSTHCKRQMTVVGNFIKAILFLDDERFVWHKTTSICVSTGEKLLVL